MLHKKQFFFTIFILVYPFILPASCFGEYFSITELLNHDPLKHHIFTCKVLKTYKRGYGSGYESIAVVHRRFVGNPNDTVYINTGGNSTAGGGNLTPTEEYLVFSTSNDNVNYRAFVCDYLSTRITERPQGDCGLWTSDYGGAYLELLELYEQIKKEKFTGYKKIVGAGKLIAEGRFLNGIPDDDWTHYSRFDNFEKGKIRSKISYRNGMLHGNYYLFNEREGENVIKEKRIYDSDLPVRIEKIGYMTTEYEYLSEKERKIKWSFLDSTGAEVQQINYVELEYSNTEYNSFGYKDGYFINKLGRDSSSYSPLAEGYYSKGARIGEWKFFNKKGEVALTKNYPELADDMPKFQTYDDEGNVKLRGLYIEGKRTGRWQNFYNNRLEYESMFDRNGELLWRIHHFRNGGFKYTPYRNKVQHGSEIVYNKDMSVRSIEKYANGKLDGLNIIFNEDGTLHKLSNFINSREFSLYSDDSTYISNGFVNGYSIQYNHKTAEKYIEGAIWNGYRTGVWVQYGKEGEYTKMHFPTDKEELMKACSESPFLSQQYDKDGNLLKSWEY